LVSGFGCQVSDESNPKSETAESFFLCAFAPSREKFRILFLFRASSARLISNGDAIAKEAS
jgi:hypothetical protein